MRANLKTTMDLYATAAGTQSGGSSLINKPGAVADSPVVRDIARHRLVKTNPDIDAGGPGSGRHKYAVGDRVIRHPKWWKDSTHPTNKGVILEQTTGKDNKGKSGLAYRFLSDYEAKEAKRKDLDPIWDKHVGKGTIYLEKELLPEKKIKAGQGTSETPQKDNAAFTGKRLVVQDTKYGHFVSEHDSSGSASLAQQARPYSRILRNPEPHNLQKSRDMSINKAAKSNPDIGE